MAYPQKLVLTQRQREVLLHRLVVLSELDPEDLDDLFGNEDREDPLDVHALDRALMEFRQRFENSAGNQLVAITIETREQGEALAECLEGSTFFASRTKGDGVYVHAAHAVAELLSTVLERDVEPHIDSRGANRSVR